VVEHDITLTCVSNTIGGELIGNARWTGVRLDELLAEAGVDPAATQVVGRSVDGYTCGFPIEAATDGRNALVAFGMNGEPLPLEHGFPVRLIVPGPVRLRLGHEVAHRDRADHVRGLRAVLGAPRLRRPCADQADEPDRLGRRPRHADPQRRRHCGRSAGSPGRRDVASAPSRCNSTTGPWQPCELGAALNDDTWRQWAFRWMPAAAGRTSIRCRATDGDGVIQTDERSEPLPDGASGHHQIVVFVE
jgi:hypothetical protein